MNSFQLGFFFFSSRAVWDFFSYTVQSTANIKQAQEEEVFFIFIFNAFYTLK